MNKKVNKSVIAVVVILIVLVLSAIFFMLLNGKKEIILASEIASISLEDNILNVEFSAENMNKNISRIEFIFKDDLGKEYYYNTSFNEGFLNYAINITLINISDFDKIREIKINFSYISEPPRVCIPDCSNKQCGDDGCGGSCGTCQGDYYCDNYKCIKNIDECEDECLLDEKKCFGDYSKSCGEYDEDECLEWGNASLCSDEVGCTYDLCNSTINSCQNILKNSLCNDNKECTDDKCSLLGCSNTNLDFGTPCSDRFCDGTGNCVECIIDSHCNEGESCENKECIPVGVFCSSGELCNNGYCNSNGNCVEPSCGMEINTNNANLVLSEDLECGDNENIIINAENVIIDCNNHKIAHIKILRYKGGNIIKNCIIEAKKIEGMSFMGGIRVEGRSSSLYNTFENNIIFCSSSFATGIFEIAPTKYEVIQNNEIYGCWAGIKADEGGFLRIYNNIIHNNDYGISATTRNYVQYNEIKNNEFYNNKMSAIIINSAYNDILDNYFHDNHLGIVMQDYEVYGAKPVFKENEFDGNKFEDNDLNIFYSSPRITSFYDDEFDIEGYCDHETFSPNCYNNEISESNLINGKPVYYWYNQHDKVIENKELGYFSCVHCSNIVLKNVKINQPNLYGVFLYDSTGITIENSEIKNSNYGVFLAKSSNCNINAVMRNNYVNFKSIDSNNNICNGQSCEGLGSLSFLGRILGFFKGLF